MMTSEPLDVVVVGGGISGLAACRRVRKRAPEQSVLLLEAAPRLGGVIRTTARDGFLLEEGPDSFLTARPEALDLCRDLGLEPEFLPTNPDCRRSFILLGGRLQPVPEGVYLLAPTSIAALWRTSLFSVPGKLRMAMEPLIPRRRATGDEALASFVRRRLGREALERLAQPMVAGIYSADPERLSLEATFPQFLEYEREYGSVIRGLARRPKPSGTSGPRYGLFLTLKEGMTGLVAALERDLAGYLRAGAPAAGLAPEGPGWRVEAGGETFQARAVILAAGARLSARLLAGASPDASRMIEGIPHGSTLAVYAAFAREAVGHPLDGMGCVIPAIEGLCASAVSFTSTKFPGRAPAGSVLLRIFAGGAAAEPLLPLPDGEIASRLIAEVAGPLEIGKGPLWTQTMRHAGAMPHYETGHLGRVAAIERALEGLPPLRLAGPFLRGVGLPQCIASGTAAADAILARL